MRGSKRGKPRTPNLRIPRPAVVPGGDAPISFSFQYLDADGNAKFRLDDCPADYLRALVSALQNWTGRTLDEFCEHVPERKNHQIAFEETTEPEGFRQLDEQLRTHEAWQFGLTRDSDWRVHGMLIGSVYHVVWLDPHHRLYKQKPKARVRRRRR
jgi:hypothetical protein